MRKSPLNDAQWLAYYGGWEDKTVRKIQQLGGQKEEWQADWGKGL